jgi:hypothetical protein
MVIELRYADPNDGTPVVREQAFHNEEFTVGRSEASTVALSPTDLNLSRTALVISEVEGLRVKIECNQRPGYVRVTRADGEHKATLNRGDELVCGAGAYTVLLRTASQDVLEVRVGVPGRPSMPELGILTQGMWSRSQIFDPTPEADWRWLAALTAVAAQTRAQHQGKALTALATAWHGGAWKANLQKRLDKVIDHLGLVGSGIDKQPAIASWVISSEVIDPADYLAFRHEVRGRALQQLKREDIGLLNWGRFTRGA